MVWDHSQMQTFSCLLFLVLLGPSLSQDTAYQDTLPKQAHGNHLKATLARLEQRLTHQIQQTERRMLWKLQDKVKRLNFSEDIHWIEGLFEFHEKEFEMLQDQQNQQRQVVADLRRQLSRNEDLIVRQNRQMSRMRSDMDDMTTMVQNLTALVQFSPGAGAGAGAISIPTVPVKPTPASSHASSPTPLPQKPGKHYPADCEEVYLHGGMKYPGNYYILIQPKLADTPFKAKCQISTDAGWTVIQRRQDGSEDFFQGWEDYKWGFGDVEGEFWMGLEHIYQITHQADNRLRIEMTTFKGDDYWAEYDHFRISDEQENYRIHIHGYQGNSGDSFTSRWNNHDGLSFSTKDHDNDHRFYDNCAEKFYGAWWFKSCYDSHLNGKYYPEGSHQDYFQRDGILWNTIHDHASLKTVTMMVRPNDNVSENSRVEKRSSGHVNSIN